MFIGGIVSALSAVCCFMMVRSLHNSEKAVRGDGALRTIPALCDLYVFTLREADRAGDARCGRGYGSDF